MQRETLTPIVRGIGPLAGDFNNILAVMIGKATLARSMLHAGSPARKCLKERRVPAASVTATNVATGLTREISTSETGHYTAALLPPGSYSVQIRKEGFRTAMRSGVVRTSARVAIHPRSRRGHVLRHAPQQPDRAGPAQPQRLGTA